MGSASSLMTGMQLRVKGSLVLGVVLPNLRLRCYGGNWLIVNVLGILNVFTGHLLQQGTYFVFWPNAFLASSVLLGMNSTCFVLGLRCSQCSLAFNFQWSLEQSRFMIVSFFTDVVVYVVLTRYCPLGNSSAASAQSSSHAASAQSGSQ